MAATAGAREVPLILVVDDDRESREVIAEALELSGYRVSTAINGKVALEQALVNQPDLIVLDMMMPVMSGLEFMEAQREEPLLAPIPVIVATARFDFKVEGAAFLLWKPFRLDTLRMIVARLCDGGRAHLDDLSA